MLATDPPLSASTWMSRAGLFSAIAALRRASPLNDTLLLVKWSYGPDRYQAPVPQSAELYWPVSGRFGLARLSKPMTLCVLPDALGGVAVGLVATGVLVGGGLGAVPDGGPIR